MLGRKNGISLLVPTQNVEETVELCLQSFKDFPDEIIVVDNGSTDNTIDIVRSIEKDIPKMKFYEAPHLKDLYENRQYAFEKSIYKWIVRIDSDYIAYNEGLNNILELREKILKLKRGIRPKAFGVSHINLFGDFFHMGIPYEIRNPNNIYHITPPFNSLSFRIIEWYPGMKFVRLGRWEGIRWQNYSKYFNHTIIKKPYWFHCTLKSKKEWLIRFERNNWRELGDFKTYPTREKYILEVIKKRYGTDDIDLAAEVHWKENVSPYLIPYNANTCMPYPQIIKDWIGKNNEENLKKN